MALFNPTTKRKKNFSWASNGCSILAEIGTLHLEYSELSQYSKNEHYLNRVLNIRNVLQENGFNIMLPLFFYLSTNFG